MPQFPWVTLILVILTCAISVPYFHRIETLEKVHETFEKSEEYQRTLVNILNSDCPSAKLSELECSIAMEILQQHWASAKDSAAIKKIIAKLKIKGISNATFEASAQRTVAYVTLLLSSPYDFNARLRAQPGFAQLQESYKDYEAMLEPVLRSGHFLTRRHRGPLQLLLAEFTHASWAHLLGNLLAFIMLAAVLEIRMGWAPFLGLYILGGSVGLLAQVSFYTDPCTILLGASANISAVIGGFFVFFFTRPIKVFVFAVVYNRMLDCPTWIALPLLYLFQDIIGALSGGSNVAHLAHLAGFAVGALIALIIRKTDGLNSYYLYPSEYDWHAQVLKAKTVPEKLKWAEKVFSYNSENLPVMEDSLLSIAIAADRNIARVEPVSLLFIKKHLSPALALAVRDRKIKKMDAFLDQIPLEIGWIDCLAGLDQEKLLALCEHQLQIGNWFSALRMSDAFRTYYPHSSGASTLSVAMHEVLTHLKTEGKDLSMLNSYISFEPRTTLRKLISEFTLQGAENVRAS